jgi:hypothetical protein
VIIVERERDRPLEPVRAGDEDLAATPERIRRDPRFVRSVGLPAACYHRRFNALAPVTGDAPRLEYRDRHESLIVAALSAAPSPLTKLKAWPDTNGKTAREQSIKVTLRRR